MINSIAQPLRNRALCDILKAKKHIAKVIPKAILKGGPRYDQGRVVSIYIQQ